jgi:hypothetical protein
MPRARFCESAVYRRSRALRQSSRKPVGQSPIQSQAGLPSLASPLSSAQVFSDTASSQGSSAGPSRSSSFAARLSPDASMESADEAQGFLSCSRLRAVGSTSTILELHGTSAVAKCFGPSEGEGDRDREEDQWLVDFEAERDVYETALRLLWGSVVPRYFGAFERAGNTSGFALILLENVGQVVTTEDEFGGLPQTTRLA